MTERQLKYRAGLFMIASHLCLLCYVIVMYFMKGFSIDEFTTVTAVITPMFAGYTTSIIAFIIKEAKILEDKTVRVNGVYAALTFVMPLLLVLAIGLAVGLKAHNKVFSNFEDFKRFLLLVESLFAAYVGMFVYSLFDKTPPQATGQDDRKEP